MKNTNVTHNDAVRKVEAMIDTILNQYMKENTTAIKKILAEAAIPDNEMDVALQKVKMRAKEAIIASINNEEIK